MLVRITFVVCAVLIQVAELVRDLGADAYERREAAMETLRAGGDEAVPMLKVARRSQDFEVRERALRLLVIRAFETLTREWRERYEISEKLSPSLTPEERRRWEVAILDRLSGREEPVRNPFASTRQPVLSQRFGDALVEQSREILEFYGVTAAEVAAYARLVG